ncbi:MAG: hypothetical protein SV377_02835, partial [Halobacteria archaeon]|nr:hypothetical protein [Halobacteria archaeon]
VGIMLGSAVAPPFFGALIENVGLRLAFFTIAGVVGTAALLTFGIVRVYADGFDTSISVQPGDD